MLQKNTTAPAERTQAALQTDAFVPHMRQVVRCESSLQELNLMWRLIESSAKMNCPQEAQALLPMMAATRAGFEQLEQDLVQSMVAQAVTGVTAGLASQAQHIIDTLVRNLYERTADVGFLATDAVLCRFVSGLDADAAPIRQRLQAYRSKYTVYEEILLLDREGQVLAGTREMDAARSRQCNDEFVARALQSQSYVQVFGASDVQPDRRSALIYAQRMLNPVTGQPAGVLCLCFDFDGEMQGIWSQRHAAAAQGAQEAESSIALLLDEQGCVLASSDVHWIGVGSRVSPHQPGAGALQIHGGRTYLVQAALAAAYQGYPGPRGWRAQLMVPLDLAFGERAQSGLQGLDAGVAQGLLAHAQKFCPPLHAIHSAADTIRRVVWNGQVMTAGKQSESSRLQAVLEQIGETGARTNEVFTQSIASLYGTVLATSLSDNRLLTGLLVDLLDRNLYERANDCRWWALTPQLPALLESLEAGDAADEQRTQVCDLLTAIHDLYTVYRQIVVYDRRGRIVAVSLRDPAGPDGRPQVLIGRHIEPDSLSRVLDLQGAQSYCVSPWRHCALHDDAEPTYVYHAAIRARHGAVLGGIGLVFHAQREFQSMLQGVLGAQTGAAISRQVAYLNRDGLVMSSSTASWPPGYRMALPADMLALEPGQSAARAMVHEGQYCVVAVTAGSGYREFKRSDGYREEVLAVAVQAFGPVQDDALAAVWRRNTRVQAAQPQHQGREMATFFVGRSVLAVDAACVLEAQSAAAIAPVSAGRLPHCVGTLARHDQGEVAGYVWVFDLGGLLYGQPVARTQQSQVLVLQHAGLKLGVLVSDLQGVARFAPQQLLPAPALAHAAGQLVDRLIKANGGDLLIQCLDVAALVQRLQAPAAESVAY
ncbi:chemotaxis protein CheW [Comamonas guangdongensis]|uniref:Chemotaxis protein CheW n=1 Tax=Comamonas guangdongensis TaxID=510515 RepID=A0ABV3ZYX9_9BURK